MRLGDDGDRRGGQIREHVDGRVDGLDRPVHEDADRDDDDEQPLELLAGPERIESGWWNGREAMRDYFIAQAGSGALVWVYRQRLPVAAARTTRSP